ncbi:MAG TPA: hypothetical protein PK514_08700 [Spirochaetota bacterium]|nr:hypothetical protein [Spirochaetota bacterium]
MNKLAAPLLITLVFSLFAFDYVQSSNPVIFSAKEKSLLRDNNIMTFVYMKGKGNAVYNVADTAGFLGISALPSSWDRYDVVIVEKAYLKVRSTDSSRLKIFNTISARSGLKGMKYYSITGGNVAKLVLESFSVKSCTDRTFLPDQVAAVIPEKYQSSFIIKDNRMGTICFNSSVEYNNAVFTETDVSCGKVSRLGMRVFNDGGYLIRHYIVPDDSGEGYFYCSVQIMKVESSIMKKLDLLNPENFGNRVRGETVHFFSRMGYDISGKITAFR